MREHLFEMIAALNAGTLRIKKQFQHQGKIVEYEAEPSILDRLNLATYARTVTDMTYRALGDHVANGGYKADASPGTPPTAPSVTIVLPAAIAKPRQEREAVVECPTAEPSAGAPPDTKLLPPVT